MPKISRSFPLIYMKIWLLLASSLWPWCFASIIVCGRPSPDIAGLSSCYTNVCSHRHWWTHCTTLRCHLSTESWPQRTNRKQFWRSEGLSGGCDFGCALLGRFSCAGEGSCALARVPNRGMISTPWKESTCPRNDFLGDVTYSKGRHRPFSPFFKLRSWRNDLRIHIVLCRHKSCYV